MFIRNKIIVLAVLFINMMQSQNFKEFRWKNRILVIETTNQDNPLYQKQLLVLKDKISELSERKLVIFEIVNQQFKKSTSDSLNQNGNWQNLDKNYKTKCIEDNEFSISLIGLDGNLKLQQNDLLLTKYLFEIIDVMPMRRNEIRNR
uniref:DUF4174 domain-containing protein n=2 Tax=Flavobacterium sp. TaxID=239 RepID=UPI00404A214B